MIGYVTGVLGPVFLRSSLIYFCSFNNSDASWRRLGYCLCVMAALVLTVDVIVVFAAPNKFLSMVSFAGVCIFAQVRS